MLSSQNIRAGESAPNYQSNSKLKRRSDGPQEHIARQLKDDETDVEQRDDRAELVRAYVEFLGHASRSGKSNISTILDSSMCKLDVV